MRKSTFAVLAASLALLTAVTAALVVPASAATQDTIVISPGQTISLTKPGLPGVGYAYGRAKDVGDYRPENCGDGGTGETICDYFPVRVNLTDAQRRNNIYIILFHLDWPGENVSVPLVITAANPQLTLTVWEDPIVEDEEPAPPCPELAPGVPDPTEATCPAPPDERPGGDEPLFQTSIGDPKPLRWGNLIEKNLAFSAIVTNYAGVNDKYTLTVELVPVEGVPDLSALDDAPVDASAIDASVDNSTPPSSGFTGFAPAGSTASDGLPALGLAELGTDSQLDSLGLRGDDALGFDEDAQQLLANRNLRDIRPPGDEATWALILWLVIVPIVVAGGGAAWALRRRSNLLAGNVRQSAVRARRPASSRPEEWTRLVRMATARSVVGSKAQKEPKPPVPPLCQKAVPSRCQPRGRSWGPWPAWVRRTASASAVSSGWSWARR